MERDGFDLSADREPLPADYLHDLDETADLTEAQRMELLSILFDIMKSFVLMGYGMEPVNRLLETFELSARDNVPVIEFDDDENDGDQGVDNA